MYKKRGNVFTKPLILFHDMVFLLNQLCFDFMMVRSTNHINAEKSKTKNPYSGANILTLSPPMTIPSEISAAS